MVAEIIAQHERRGELVDDLLKALEAAKLRERQAAACHRALTRSQPLKSAAQACQIWQAS